MTHGWGEVRQGAAICFQHAHIRDERRQQRHRRFGRLTLVGSIARPECWTIDIGANLSRIWIRQLNAGWLIQRNSAAREKLCVASSAVKSSSQSNSNTPSSHAQTT